MESADILCIFSDAQVVEVFFNTVENFCLSNVNSDSASDFKKLCGCLSILSNMIQNGALEEHILKTVQSMCLKVIKHICYEIVERDVINFIDSFTFIQDILVLCCKFVGSEMEFSCYNFLTNFTDVIQNIKSDCDRKPLLMLNIIHIMIKSLPRNITLKNCEAVIKLLSLLKSNKDIEEYVILTIFPILLERVDPLNESVILKYIWTYVKSKAYPNDNSSCHYEHVASGAMCILVNILKPVKMGNEYIFDVTFWKIIFTNCTSTDTVIRKQSHYMLRKLLHWLKFLCNEDISSCPDWFLLHNSSENNLSIWADLLSVLEVLEQKQLHIIKPHLPKVIHFLSDHKQHELTTSNSVFNLGMLWVLTIFQRMWNHESKYIRQWSIQCFLNQEHFPLPQDFDDHIIRVFYKAIFKALNDSTFYVRPEYDDPETMVINHELMKKFFATCSTSNSAFGQKENGNIINFILIVLTEEEFSPVPLLYIMKALSEIPECKVWKKADILNIRKVLEKILQSSEPVLRQSAASYFVEICLLFLDMRDIYYEDLCALLNAFINSDLLMPNSLLLPKVIKCLKKNIFDENIPQLSVISARKFCNENLISLTESFSIPCTNNFLDFKLLSESSIKCILRTWWMFSEIGVFCSEPCKNQDIHDCLTFLTFFDPLLQKLEDILHYQHSYNAIKYAVDFLFVTAKEMQKDDITILFVSRVSMLEIINKVMCSSVKKLNATSDFEQIDLLLLLLKMFDVSITYGNKNLQEKLLLTVLQKCTVLLKENFHQSICQIQFWCLISKVVPHVQRNSTACKHLNEILIPILQNGNLNHQFRKPPFNSFDIYKDIWRNCSNNAVSGICHALRFYIEYNIQDFADVYETLFNSSVFEIMEDASRENMSILFETLEFILLKTSNEDIVCEVLRVSWNSIKSLGFHHMSFKAFINMCFQPHLIKEFGHIFIQYLQLIKTLEDRPGYLGMLYLHICEIFYAEENCNDFIHYVPFLCDGLLFGPIRRKDQRVITEAIEYVLNDKILNDCSLLQHLKADSSIRMEVICVILSKVRDNDTKNFVILLVNDLLMKHQEINNEKPSYYLNSIHHRLQNRIWQFILLVNEVLYDKDTKYNLLLKILNESLKLNSQMSVKYFQEWISIRIIYSYPEFLDDIFSTSINSFQYQPAYQVRILSIIVHLIGLDLLKAESLALAWMPLLLKFCVAHSFEIRLHGGLALQRLWTFCLKNSYFNVLEKFSFIKDSELTSPKTGNYLRNIQQLDKSYYFSSFHPLNSFNFQTIFVELPHQANVTLQEWIFPSSFIQKSKQYLLPKQFVIHHSSNIEFRGELPSLYGHKNPIGISLQNVNFQRKILPQKTCEKYSSYMISNHQHKNYKAENTKEIQLIVVASLVEKVPNLGGLCRSCEALGVSEFVIRDLKCIDDKAFQSVSVSAEKWIKISEVKVHRLEKYLIEMKSRKFTIIGCEQTEKSKVLTDFSFPQKCLILLGNEKEGIPVELLKCLDISVEIPQNGVIRSLNVHVAGALIIYEFFRQHKGF